MDALQPLLKQSNQYLLKQVRALEDRVEVAEVLVELAERAERSPLLQETLRKIKLRPPFDVLEYRKPRNRKGYWVRKPYTREHPTIPQLQARLGLSEIAFSLFGEKGTVERTDGTRIARINHLIGLEMRGRKTASEEEKAERQRQKTIERIAL